MKQILTTHAMTSGILIADCKYPACFELRNEYFIVGGQSVFTSAKDCHNNQTSAKQRVRELFAKRRKSLEKTLSKLDEKEDAAWKIIENSGLPVNSENP